MDSLFVIFALAIPALLGGVWLQLLVPSGGPGRATLVAGNGTLLGLVLLPQLMIAIDALGAPLNFLPSAAAALALILPALLLQALRPGTGVASRMPGGNPNLSPGARALFLLLLGLVLLRTVNLGLEILWRPLFPWDATMHWATKARVWFEHRALLPFVSSDAWLAAGGQGVFTDEHPNYPATVPLLQVWMNLAVDRWDESLMNLPWLLCFVALGAAFYGQSRRAGCSAVTAMAFTYLLLSLPLLNIHVALAGYADIYLGAAYCAAVMACHNWSVSGDRWQLALALVFALCCPLIKNEGLIWALTLIPAIASRLLPPALVFSLYLCGVLVLALAYFVLPGDLQVAGQFLHQLYPAAQPGALAGVAKATLLHANWHLAGYLLALLVALTVLLRVPGTRRYLPLATALGFAVLAFLFLFGFTGYGWGATHFTAVGRLSIQLAPGLMFFAALLAQGLLDQYSPANAAAEPGQAPLAQ